MMLSRLSSAAPRRWPLFWTYRQRLGNWLAEDTVPVFYDVSGSTNEAYVALVRCAEKLGRRGGCYMDHAERFIYGNESLKGNAGTQSLIDRRLMNVGTAFSAHLHLAFAPVSFTTTHGSVHFLPDEMLVAHADGNCWFVPYFEISLHLQQKTHCGVPVPNWCQPVGYTWQFMNKDGGPDRRYNHNPQIAHYPVWELDFTFPGGRLDTAFADQRLVQEFAETVERLIALSRSRSR